MNEMWELEVLRRKTEVGSQKQGVREPTMAVVRVGGVSVMPAKF